MPISGLVVVCQSPEILDDKVIEPLSRHCNIEIGQRCANQLAIVVDTESKEQDLEIGNWISSLPGVLEIRITFIGFDDENSITQES